MKNYTVAIVFSSLYIAYVLLSMLTSTVMNRRYRAPNVTPDDQDAEPTMRPIRPSIISNLRPTSLDNRWSSSSFDEVGEPGDWDLNEKIHGLSQFMKSNNIRGRSSLDLTKPFDKQVNSFLRP